MAVDARIIIRLRELPYWGEINEWRRDILIAFNPEDFDHDGPLRLIPQEDYDLLPFVDEGTWVDLGVTGEYYGKGYERGDPNRFVRMAEWIEARIPDAEVFYGTDNSDEMIEPFGQDARTSLLAYFAEVGHEPYLRERRAGARETKIRASSTPDALPEFVHPRGKPWHDEAGQSFRFDASPLGPDFPITVEHGDAASSQIDDPILMEAESQIILSLQNMVTFGGILGGDLNDQTGDVMTTEILGRPAKDDPKVGSEGGHGPGQAEKERPRAAGPEDEVG